MFPFVFVAFIFVLCSADLKDPYAATARIQQKLVKFIRIQAELEEILETQSEFQTIHEKIMDELEEDPDYMEIRENIERSLSKLIHFAMVPNANNRISFQSEAFFIEYDIRTLIDGLLGSDNSSDILLTTRDVVQCDTNELLKMMEPWRRLIMAGIYVNGAYLQLSIFDLSERTEFKNEMMTSIDELDKRQSKVIAQCRSSDSDVEDIENDYDYSL